MQNQSKSQPKIKPGKYSVQLTNSKTKQSKLGHGEFIELGFEIVEGRCIGQNIFDRIYRHPDNPQAKQVVSDRLAELIRATGVRKLNDTSELVGHHFKVTVGTGALGTLCFPRVSIRSTPFTHV